MSETEKYIAGLEGDQDFGRAVLIDCNHDNRLACLELDQLIHFQGNLKTLADDQFQKLRQGILKEGIIVPFFVWVHEGQTYILDGHQRAFVLRKLRDDEGYHIPPLPVFYIEARDRKHAAERLLAITSTYGKIDRQGLYEFTEGLDLRFPDLELPDLPDFDEVSFELEYYGDPKGGTGEGDSQGQAPVPSSSRLATVLAQIADIAAFVLDRTDDEWLLYFSDSHVSASQFTGSDLDDVAAEALAHLIGEGQAAQ